MAHIPKVLVGCPTSSYKSYCLKEYVRGVTSLTYTNYTLLLVDNSETKEYSSKIKALGLPVVKDTYLERAKDRIVHSRNILRKEVLEKGYDYFLSLEQDVIPPKDIIERLLRHTKQVVTGVYFTQYRDHGRKVLKPVLWEVVPEKEGKMRFVSEETLRTPQLLRVMAAGLGCILIHRSVLELVSFRLFSDKRTYDDMPFCQDLAAKDILLFTDTSVKCKHLISGMDWSRIKE